MFVEYVKWKSRRKFNHVDLFPELPPGICLAGVSLKRMVDSQSFILHGTRGGIVRSQILEALAAEPRTVEDLAATLRSDARTLRKHLAVLEANDMVDAPTGPDDTQYVLVEEVPPLPE